MRQKAIEAKRWLKQASHDLLVAKKNLENQFYSDACYYAEQTAQKALKAYLYFQGERFVWEHSVAALIKKSSFYDQTFTKLRERGKVLDQYYIPTRYPDALAPPAVPFESYKLSDAEEAIKIAQEILKTVKALIGSA